MNINWDVHAFEKDRYGSLDEFGGDLRPTYCWAQAKETIVREPVLFLKLVQIGSTIFL